MSGSITAEKVYINTDSASGGNAFSGERRSGHVRLDKLLARMRWAARFASSEVAIWLYFASTKVGFLAGSAACAHCRLCACGLPCQEAWPAEEPEMTDSSPIIHETHHTLIDCNVQMSKSSTAACRWSS